MRKFNQLNMNALSRKGRFIRRTALTVLIFGVLGAAAGCSSFFDSAQESESSLETTSVSDGEEVDAPYAAAETEESDASSEEAAPSASLSPYIREDIFNWFSMTKEDLDSQMVAAIEYDCDESSDIARFTSYASGPEYFNTTSILYPPIIVWNNAEVIVRYCDMTQYTREYPDIFYDVTGHNEGYVDAVVLPASEVFTFKETDSIEQVIDSLEPDVALIHGKEIYYDALYWSDYSDSDVVRLEFLYNGYLFSMRLYWGIQETLPWEEGYGTLTMADAGTVYISNTNADKTDDDLVGTYAAVSSSDNLGTPDIEYDLPSYGILLTIEEADGGYTAIKYGNLEGTWIPLEDWNSDAPEIFISGDTMRTDYLDEEGNLLMDTYWDFSDDRLWTGSEEGVTYRKLAHPILSPVSEEAIDYDEYFTFSAPLTGDQSTVIMNITGDHPEFSAYADLLNNHPDFAARYNNLLKRESKRTFSILDLNEDGVYELIVDIEGSTNPDSARYICAYNDGQIQFVEIQYHSGIYFKPETGEFMTRYTHDGVSVEHYIFDGSHFEKLDTEPVWYYEEDDRRLGSEEEAENSAVREAVHDFVESAETVHIFIEATSENITKYLGS